MKEVKQLKELKVLSRAFVWDTVHFHFSGTLQLILVVMALGAVSPPGTRQKNQIRGLMRGYL